MEDALAIDSRFEGANMKMGILGFGQKGDFNDRFHH